ncbi:MAG: DUF2490 domain-containing protein [Bacteroidia bacterium]
MKRCVLFLTISLSAAGFAQQSYNDAQLWFNLYLEKRLTKHLDIHLNQQDRWDQNISHYRLGYADVGFTWRFTKDVKILADYVFTQKARNIGSFSTRHQFYVALSLKKDIRRWRFIYRNMVQLQYNDPMRDRYGFFPYYKDRNKFTIKYEVNKRIDLYVASEIYFPLNLPNNTFHPDRVRYFAGMFINITKHHQLELYYMIQDQLHNDIWFKQKNRYPNTLLNRYFVIGIGYAIQY